MKKLTARSLAVLAVASAMAFSNPLWAWTTHLDFEDGPNGQQAQGVSAFSEGFTTIYSTESAYHGRQSAKMHVTGGSDGWGEWGSIFNLPAPPGEGAEMWFRVAACFPPNFDHMANPRLKFLRIHTRSAGSENEGYLDMYILPNGLFTYDNEILNTVAMDLGAPLQKGTWGTYEIYVKFSSVPGAGIVRIWQNGVLIHENRDWKTLSTPSSYSDRVHIFTYWNGGAPQSQTALIDDVVITTDTPAGRDAFGNPMIGPAPYGG